jgi:hypothetical protein
MVDESNVHAACVTTWLEHAAAGLPAAGLLDLLELAFEALWSRVRPTLGDVTLGAIADRVVHDASERFPPCGSLVVGPSGFQFEGLRARLDEWRAEELEVALRAVLFDFLTVFGHLTAEVLTPALHATLAGVGRAAPAAPGGRAKAGPGRGKKRKKS